MGLFGRKKKDQAPAERPPSDPDLPVLDVAQAARLRALAHADLTGRGLETLVYPTHVTVDGHSFGLHNLAANVARYEDAAWPDLVRAHFDTMSTEDEGPQLGLSDEELERAVYVRLMPDGPEMRRMFSRFGNRVPGLVAVPCVDLPQKVAFEPESFYEERGGFDRWWRLGFDNLETLLRDQPLEHYPVGRDSEVPRFDIVAGDCVMVASFALLLPHLLARFEQSDLGRGVLVAIPERSKVMFRVIDGAEALPAIAVIARMTAASYDTAVGALTPHVFLVNQTGWHQLTRIEGDTTQIMIDDEVAAAFDVAMPD